MINVYNDDVLYCGCTELIQVITVVMNFNCKTKDILCTIIFAVQGLGTLAKRKEKRKVLSHHLFFCMRDFSYHLGEDAEVYFSLYDSQKQKFIRWLITWIWCIHIPWFIWSTDVINNFMSIISCFSIFSFLFFFSERFLVKLSKEGFSNYVEKIHSNCTIFTVSW